MYDDYRVLRSILDHPDGGNPDAVFSLIPETGGVCKSLVIEVDGERRATEKFWGMSLLQADEAALERECQRLTRLRGRIDGILQDIEYTLARKKRSRSR